VTVYAQLRDLNHISSLRTAAIGLAPAWHFLDTEQRRRHEAVLDHSAGDPPGYRIVANALIEAVRHVFPAISLPLIFIALRLSQNAAIFALAASYFASFGFRHAVVNAGLAALAWSFCFANYNAGLAFDTYFDILFYLVAATLIVRGRYALVTLVALVAAANRETALLIPVLMAVADDGRPARRRLVLAAVTFLGQLAVIVAIRLAVGPQPLILPEGHAAGTPLLAYNVGRAVTWLNLGTTFLFVPFVAAFAWRRGPPRLRKAFVVIVPIWTVVHFVAAIVAETRLFLVPWVIVALPGALMALDQDG
jgi:hypothetical protein